MGRGILIGACIVACAGALGCGDDSSDSGAAGMPAAPGADTTMPPATGPAAGTTGGMPGATGAAPNMPDTACMGMPSTSAPECQACSCTPNAMGGCLDELTACQGNADAMAAQLCGAVIDCCVANGVSGTECLTPCMTEIAAAAGYMGGGPLTAATAVGDCSAMSCGSVCM